MMRPSRGERWSATTTRQIGSFFPPTRVSLSRTDIAGQTTGLATLAHERPEVGHAPLPELLHHLAHLAELLDQLVHRLDVGSRALRDPQPARALDELRVAALLR